MENKVMELFQQFRQAKVIMTGNEPSKVLVCS